MKAKAYLLPVNRPIPSSVLTRTQAAVVYAAWEHNSKRKASKVVGNDVDAKTEPEHNEVGNWAAAIINSVPTQIKSNPAASSKKLKATNLSSSVDAQQKAECEAPNPDST